MTTEYDELTTLVLEKVSIAAQASISYAAVRRAKAETLADPFARQLVVSIETYMYGNQIHRQVTGHVEFPASWWQAVKAAFFPDWLRRHYPVRYERRETSVSFTHVCPHLDLAVDDETVHLRYLMPPHQVRIQDSARRAQV